jgi:hypothetical protein
MPLEASFAMEFPLAGRYNCVCFTYSIEGRLQSTLYAYSLICEASHSQQTTKIFGKFDDLTDKICFSEFRADRLSH